MSHDYEKELQKSSLFGAYEARKLALVLFKETWALLPRAPYRPLLELFKNDFKLTQKMAFVVFKETGGLETFLFGRVPRPAPHGPWSC